MKALVLGCGALALLGCGPGRPDPAEIFPGAAELAEAAAEGDSVRIQELVRGGADPNARGDKGVTLLHWALLHRSESGLAGLLVAGADPSLPDSSGATVVHLAALANDPAYLQVLLAHRADPNAPNGVTGATPLMAALMGDREVQFRALLEAGARPDLADRMGHTALHVAAQINAFARVLVLLEAGADPAARTERGLTFQRYLNTTPDEILTDEARRQKGAINAWLREHGVPLEEG